MAVLKPAEFERAKRQAPEPTFNPKAAYYAARADARGEYPEITRTRTATVKTKTGGQYSYTYADLSDVFSAINPILSRFGLDVSQWPEGNEIVTEVSHAAGYEKQYRWPVKPMQGRDLVDAMSYQSAVQIAKRYALTAALGIATEETVEGDEKAHRYKNQTNHSNPSMNLDENFDTADGKRLPRGAKVTQGMSKRQIAEEVARAIEEQFNDPKTAVGLNGAWNRNEVFIDLLSQKHSDLFDNVHDAFHARMEALSEE